LKNRDWNWIVKYDSPLISGRKGPNDLITVIAAPLLYMKFYVTLQSFLLAFVDTSTMQYTVSVSVRLGVVAWSLRIAPAAFRVVF